MNSDHSSGFRRILLSAILLAAVRVAEAADQPNVIVIFTDDHGYSDLSCQEIMADIRTPNIDRLAASGVRMTSGYVTAPQCVPSRAGLLSGRYQNRFGVESNGQPLDGFNVQTTIAERLKSAGYATGMTGKWHLGPHQEIVEHGFDDVYYKNANRPGWANFGLDGRDRTPGVEDSTLYHIDTNSAAACAFIDRHRAESFFFYCAYRAPHVPLDAPQKYLDRFPGEMPERRRQALAMLSAVDDGVGRILDTLKKYRLEENTLLFFIGDNGAPLKIHKLDAPGDGAGWDGSLNDPLNGEKGMLSEGGIRVPFVVAWPGRIPAGQVCPHPVISLDVASTALAAAGQPVDTKLDGANLLPVLTGQSDVAPHATLYWRWIAQSAIREGQWKYLRGGQREYLFDLNADPDESRNLIQQRPEIAANLSAKLGKWAQELTPPGLETKTMAATWEQYFDYYLDGKRETNPQPAATPAPVASSNGWLARNATLERKNGFLNVHPDSNHRQPPFIVVSGLNVPGRVSAVVRLKSPRGGSAGVAWREDGQNDFPPGQIVRFDCAESETVQEQRIAIPARKNIIHLRLLLPGSPVGIESVRIDAADGAVLKQWSFQQ